jgi:hypothetical protein
MPYGKLRMAQYNLNYRGKNKPVELLTGQKVKVTWSKSKQLGKIGKIVRKSIAKKYWVEIDGAEYIFNGMFLEVVI